MSQSLRILARIRARRGLSYWAALCGTVLALLASDWLSDQMAILPGGISPVGVVTAVTLVIVWFWGAGIWPGVWVGCLLGRWELLVGSGPTGETIGAALALATAGTVQPLVAVTVLRKLFGDEPLDRARRVFGFAAVAGLTGLLQPTVGVFSLHAAGALSPGMAAVAWQAWWWSDAAGLVVWSPFLLVWLRPVRRPWNRARRWEAVAALTVLLVAGAGVFGGLCPGQSLWPYVLFPILLWVAMRLGRHGTTAGLVITTGMALWGTMQGHGPFAQNAVPLPVMLVPLQGFIGVTAVTFLALAAANSDHHRAEDALRRSEAMVQRLFEAVPDALIVVDAAGRITRVNAQAVTMFGFSRAALLSQPIEMLLPERYRAAHVNHRAEYRQHPTLRPMGTGLELFGRRQNGEEFPVDVMLSPVESEGGPLVVAIVRDVTERRRTEAELLAERQLLRALMDNIPDKIYFKDLQSRFVRVNKADVPFLGAASEAEVLGKTDFDFFSEEHARQAFEDEQEVIRTGQPIVGKEEKETWPDGHVTWASSTKLPWRDATGQVIGTFGISRDITERKQAEQEVAQLNVELARRARELEATNQELEAFSYSVSHDLRAPLRAIDGFSRLLLTTYRAQLPAEAQQYLRYVRENARQMGQLIEDLLTFSRLGRQGLRKERLDLTALVQRCWADLAGERAGREVVFQLDTLPPGEADPAMLKQVMVNLLSNALKFSRKRAPSIVRVGAQENPDAPGRWVYFVQDNGVGFDMRYQDKLFGVFQRLHRAEEYEGTGVGLALVQRIIHRHGGRVWAQAELERGATFYFTLEGDDCER